MQGFDVWDRPGYDMHGLPTEKATEKELGITTREQILALGTEKFIEHCRALCIRNMNDMTEVFKSMGVWMQWDDPYISIDRDYMEGEWWLIKRVHDLGRLYEGEKTMTWDSVNGTALAKHELYYSTVVDKAIYVRFKLLSSDPMWENTSVVVWTTTPWTIPFNLAVMVHPTINYCQVEINGHSGKERVLVAEALLSDFLETKLGLDRQSFSVLQTLPGSVRLAFLFEKFTLICFLAHHNSLGPKRSRVPAPFRPPYRQVPLHARVYACHPYYPYKQ